VRFEGRRALVTGGGSGIGRATSELFAQEGAAVAVVDLREERARETAEAITARGGQAVPLLADVSDADAVQAAVDAAVDALGPMDVVVNNAAIASGDDIVHIDEEDWDLNLRVVLKSVYLVSRAVLPSMLERGSGAIVNISSVNGLTGFGMEAYSAGKAGMINLTRNMALKYGPRGVRVNAICPGTVQTPIWSQFLKDDPQVLDRLAKWYPLGRVGQPDDIARAALFLASDEAAWITGIDLPVDGGLMAGLFRMSADVDLGGREDG
jgi:NAD(P)-dependent dehydrogenase (short-subunit alcohol dehydrogenase family)